MDYPFEIATVIRQNKTFCAEAKFSRETEDKPLTVFSEFSRFVLTIIQNGKFVTCNVPLDMLEEVKAVTDEAKRIFYGKKEETAEKQSIAFTKRFFSGSLKGKTPVEVLREPNGRELLNNQYKWLKENISKFPKNKELMDAIVEASKLSEDEINAHVANETSCALTIMDVKCRPLVRKKREDGKCFCYEYNAVFDSTRSYPVSLTVKNYYAPVKKTDKGLLNVELAQKDKASELVHEFSFTMSEWINFVNKMDMAVTAYYNAFFVQGMNLAGKADKENREAASKAAEKAV